MIQWVGEFMSGVARLQVPRMTSRAAKLAASGEYAAICASASMCPSGGRACPEPRRGILLLIALIMLALFMLLGTSYILIANRRRPCTAIAGSTGSRAESAATDTSNQASDDILTGQPDGASNGGTVGTTVRSRVAKYFTNSLLADKYGDIYEQTSLVSIVPLTATDGSTTNIPFFTIETAGAFTYGPASTIANYTQPPDLGSHVGRILAIESQLEPNAAFRIVSRSGSSYVAHLVNPEAEFDYRNLAAGGLVTIQGREFSGDSADSFQLHENYDAPDNRNLFMAWVPTEATLGRDQVPGTGDDPSSDSRHRYVIPSFHRPDNLAAMVKSNPAGFYSQWLDSSAIAMLRPAGRMSWDPSIDWPSTYGIAAPVLPSGSALEHPNFTGGNVQMVGGNPRYFDPLHGPWDVDNDGDGVADSIWIDIGMPLVDIGTAQCQPLVAMMILDLDGRVNVNAHGTDIPFNRAPTRPAPAIAGFRYAGTVSATASGTTGPKLASLPHAQGWGVADIPLLNVFGVDLGGGLSRGSVLTGSSTTQSGVVFPAIKAEGRFGDSAAGAGILGPAPGLLNLADPGIDAAGATPRDNHIPNAYAVASGSGEQARASAIMSPVDTRGTMTVGLDQFGQPFFSKLRSDTWPDRLTRSAGPMWDGDRIDDPYDLSLGRRAPRPGWSFDPDVQASPSTLQDDLFTPPQFERLLRMFEAGSDRLSPRLVSLLGPYADIARVSTTIESWDTPAVTIPRARLEPLLALSDQATQNRPSLVSWDLALGLRMNINRPFGDGIDNDSDGIADEPGEYEVEMAGNAFGMNGTGFASQCLTNGRDVDGDGDVDFGDQERARELFARHLYVLARIMAPSVPAKEIAQWAVNVVDMRDPDSIITRFNYDKNCPDALDSRYPDPDGVSSTWAPDPADVVWGCERPELLITEAMAWRNIRSGTTATPGQTGYIDDKGTGGLVIELFNPWVGTTETGSRASGLPAEFQPNPTGTSGFSRTSSMDLARVNASGDPVFQILAVAETGTSGTTGTLANLAANAAWPQLSGSATSGSINGLVIYPAKVSGTAVRVTGTLGTFVSRDGPNVEATTLKPGQFALVSGPVASGSSATLTNTIDISATGTAAMTFNYSSFSDGTPGQVLQFTTGITETITGSNGFNPSDRSSGQAFPDNESAGPVGALVCVENTSGTSAVLRFPVISGTMTLPELTSSMESQKYRLLLRRLANPLQPYNGSFNPYICIDSMVIQDQAVVAGDPTAPGAAPPLRSAERCAAQKADKSDNNLWRHATDDDTTNVALLKNPLRGPLSSVNASLGFLPARLKIPSDADLTSETEQPVFPWLTWLNREFVSPHELLLVPKSSPATLLRDHTHNWPFKHLFFQLGSGTTAADQELEANKAGILELLRVPSRFADAETRIPPADATVLSTTLVAQGGRPMFLPPHNYLSHFREPGRVNLNTMSNSAIWAALNNGRPGAPYEDEVSYGDSGAPLAFNSSEDWRLPSASGSSPLSGNWQVDNPEEDVNRNSTLDVNDDANNDGRRQVSKSGVLQSIASSRRGWPISTDGSTPTIAGQFDRVLNRAGLASDQLWFSNPFQSGWKSGNSAYATDSSLMLRNWPATTSTNFMRIPAGSSYRRLTQTAGVTLTANTEYVCTIRIKGNVTLNAMGTDKLPEMIVAGGGPMLDPYAISRSVTDTETVYTASLRPTVTDDHRVQVAIWSQQQLDISSVSLTPRDGGTELLTNSDFATGQTGWTGDGVLQTDSATATTGPVYLMATNLSLRDSQGKQQDGRPYADPRRNPFFRYREMMRLSNLTTSRSNVFAVWMTVGFFVVEPHPTIPNQTALGAEYGLDTGDNVRFKSFLIIDRSIPVGFRPGVPLNSRDTVILDHFGN